MKRLIPKRWIPWFAAFFALGMLTSASDAQVLGKRGAKAQTPAGWPRKAEGYGLTVDAAREHAVENAVKAVVACLQKQDPPLDAWQPDEAYVRKNLLADNGEGDAGDDVLVNNQKVKSWIVLFKDSPPWTEMVNLNQAEARRVAAADRKAIAAYVLAALTALLATGWGYLRVDEWTRGRCSKWLAIGAVSALSASGAVWWINS